MLRMLRMVSVLDLLVANTSKYRRAVVDYARKNQRKNI